MVIYDPLLSQNSSINQGEGRGCLFEWRGLFYILADRRGVYSKGALLSGVFNAPVHQNSAVAFQHQTAHASERHKRHTCVLIYFLF